MIQVIVILRKNNTYGICRFGESLIFLPEIWGMGIYEQVLKGLYVKVSPLYVM